VGGEGEMGILRLDSSIMYTVLVENRLDGGGNGGEVDGIIHSNV
jgi:hypothetical protein